MANTKSAEKAARQAERNRERNVAMRSQSRTAIRGIATAIAGGDKAAAVSAYRNGISVIDGLVNKRIIHRNKAARHKSRLAARIKALG
ncbi:MAG: 30S ribosomal protein S20 [Steroidobacteraceae bacterium]